MHLSHIPQCTVQNRNVHISVLNGALWDMGQVYYGICEIGHAGYHITLWLTLLHKIQLYYILKKLMVDTSQLAGEAKLL